MKPINARIQQFRFTDSLAGIITLATIHLMCGLITLSPGEESLLVIGRGQYCLCIALLFGYLYKCYGWQDSSTNNLLIGIFLASLLLEWFSFGVPTSTISYSSDYSGYSKGFALTFFLKMLPVFYVGFRVFSVYFLINTALQARKLSAITNPTT